MTVALKDSPSSSASADGGGVDLLKNCRFGDTPAYNAKQLLRAQVVGAFAQSRCTCYLLEYWPGCEFQPERRHDAGELVMLQDRSTGQQVVVQRCMLVLDGVQSGGFELRSETSYKFGPLRAFPWVADQVLGSVVAVVHNDKQARDVVMSWISGGCKQLRTSFGYRFLKRRYRTAMLASLDRSDVRVLLES
eukprot:5539170-Pleurochrysis_carterae.AAC.1